ncbi:MAG: T9SS C-terminal target domain-containing protein [Calditrichaeota bacterium]|nr:MAG: T9SS C-terminal target domain-containing protein [Calditrichota bacterium]
MKKLVTNLGLLFLIGIFMLSALPANAQNVIPNGSFETEGFWNIYNGGAPDEIIYSFPYTDGKPFYGSGNASLYVYGERVIDPNWMNGLIWQQVELIGGTSYVLDAAWKYLDGDLEAGSWFQIYVGQEEPVDGVDYTAAGGTQSDRMLSFNSWSGCSGIDLDETFMDYACENNHAVIYRTPGEVGQPVSAYVALKTGAGWTGSLFELLIDDIALRPNKLVDGDFEDGAGWTLTNIGAPAPLQVDMSEADTFGPNLGQANYLAIRGDASAGACGGVIWQKTTLIGGATYGFNGGFRDIGGAGNYYCEVYMSTEAPVDGAPWKPAAGSGSDKLTGFNASSTCNGVGINGTFRRDGCTGKATTLYTVPGAAGTSVDVYIGIAAGCETGTFEITLDDVSLVLLSDVGTEVSDEATPVPVEFALSQNYPNPFNPATEIRFSVPTSGQVELAVYNVLGDRVATLVNGVQAAGEHRLQFNAEQLSSGVYLYQLTTASEIITRRMVVLK